MKIDSWYKVDINELPLEKMKEVIGLLLAELNLQLYNSHGFWGDDFQLRIKD